MTIYSLVYFISRYNIHGNVIPGNAKLYRETNAPFVIVIFVLSLGGGVMTGAVQAKHSSLQA